MIKRFHLVGRHFWCGLALSLSLGQAGAASWYVDLAAVGANTGRSWPDAWTNLTAINWRSFRPGDTLYLSGGRAGRNYYESLAVGASGTSNAPITIKPGRGPEHDGAIRLLGLEVGRHQWITIDGARNDSFVAPTNVVQLRAITNNIGIFCANTNGTAIYLTAPVGVKLHWIGVEAARRGASRHAHGIYANVTRRGPTDYNQIKYCWIQNTDDDGIQWIGNDPATHFGHQEVAFSIIENVGDDGLEANHGFSVHDCIIGPSRFVNGHPDGIQSGGSFWKIYNNEFHDFYNSWLRLQAMQTNHHDVWVYNNLFLSGRYGNPKVFIYNTGIEVVQYAAWLGEVPAMTWDRILICNNTFYGAERLVGGAIAWAKRDERTKAAFVHNVIVTNSLIVNNVIVDCGRGVGAWWQPLKSAPPWGRAVHYTESGLRLDSNVITGRRAPDARRIGYFGVVHPSGERMARSSVWKHNSAAPVKFANAAAWNFELATGDEAAGNQGANLADYFTHDILNRPRGGNWDRGAFESAK